MDSGSKASKPEISQPWQAEIASVCVKQGRMSYSSKHTSPEIREIADGETIGSCVVAGGLAKLATVLSTPSGITRSRLVEGIGTSPTFPLEVSFVCMEGA
jgi:hypothetical protein